MGRAFQNEAFQDLDCWDFKSRAWAFYSVGQGQLLEELEYSVGRTWQLEGLRGEAWPLIICKSKSKLQTIDQ